jgi:hypothetical protein
MQIFLLERADIVEEIPGALGIRSTLVIRVIFNALRLLYVAVVKIYRRCFRIVRVKR